jgi:hypothetical protein
MPCPGRIAGFGVFEPGCLFAREPNDQDIVPPVLVEIARESKKVIRIGIVHAQGAFESLDRFIGAVGFLAFEGFCCGVIFVTFFEVGSFVPVGARHEVYLSVVIKIAKRSAFRPKLVAQLCFFEGMSRRVGGQNASRAANKEEEGPVEHLFHLA